MKSKPPRILELAVEASEGPWVRGLFAILSGISSFIEFTQAGLSLLFWILSILAISAFTLTLIPLLVRKSRYARLISMISGSSNMALDREQTLLNLVTEIRAFQKARSLSETVKNRQLKAITIREIEGKIGVLVDAGEDDNMQVGTPLLLFQIEEKPETDQPLELRLGILEVTYVQASNNCSQAVLISPIDWEFWNKVRSSLKKSATFKPPPNIMLPYIPSDMSDLSDDDFALIIEYLSSVQQTMQTHIQSALAI